MVARYRYMNCANCMHIYSTSVRAEFYPGKTKNVDSCGKTYNFYRQTPRMTEVDHVLGLSRPCISAGDMGNNAHLSMQANIIGGNHRRRSYYVRMDSRLTIPIGRTCRLSDSSRRACAPRGIFLCFCTESTGRERNTCRGYTYTKRAPFGRSQVRNKVHPSPGLKAGCASTETPRWPGSRPGTALPLRKPEQCPRPDCRAQPVRLP